MSGILSFLILKSWISFWSNHNPLCSPNTDQDFFWCLTQILPSHWSGSRQLWIPVRHRLQRKEWAAAATTIAGAIIAIIQLTIIIIVIIINLYQYSRKQSASGLSSSAWLFCTSRWNGTSFFLFSSFDNKYNFLSRSATSSTSVSTGTQTQSLAPGASFLTRWRVSVLTATKLIGEKIFCNYPL